MRDPQVPDMIYLRWERGVMAYDRRANQVQVAQLGEMFAGPGCSLWCRGHDAPANLHHGAPANHPLRSRRAGRAGRLRRRRADHLLAHEPLTDPSPRGEKFVS